jgi:hypothetical protein
MNHLKVFEDFDGDMLYKQITMEDWDKFKERDKLTNIEIEKLKELFSDYSIVWRIGTNWKDVPYDPKSNSEKMSYGIGVREPHGRPPGYPYTKGEMSKFLLMIFKTQDDYFQVATFTHDGYYRKFYLCDWIDGVEKLLHDIEFYETY